MEKDVNDMKYDVKDLGLAAEGKARIDWAARNMPVLRRIPLRTFPKANATHHKNNYRQSSRLTLKIQLLSRLLPMLH